MLFHTLVLCFLQYLHVTGEVIATRPASSRTHHLNLRRCKDHPRSRWNESRKSDAQIMRYSEASTGADKLTLDASELVTLDRMKYWAEGGAQLPSRDQYLLFSLDDGGPNNMRIGWELAGVIAQYTDRTLVLPPATGMYLLDWGPMSKKYHPAGLKNTKTSVEDLINMNQLKETLSTLSASEFAQHTGVSWEDAVSSGKKSQKGDCSLPHYANMRDRFVFLSGHDRMPFSCGEWWALGGPKESMTRDMHEDNWRLLRHGFVWHDDVFNVAAKVVNYLGLFEYMAVHARYNDFQFHEFQKPANAIFGKWQPWLTNGTTLYVATDDPSKFRDVELPGVRLVMWDDLFLDATGHLLSDTKAKFTPERWFKLFGPVEELICTYAKLFVGTDRSSFSGHIDRMRIHANAPVTSKLTHTDAVPKATIDNELRLWTQEHEASRKVTAAASDRFL